MIKLLVFLFVVLAVVIVAMVRNNKKTVNAFKASELAKLDAAMKADIVAGEKAVQSKLTGIKL